MSIIISRGKVFDKIQHLFIIFNIKSRNIFPDGEIYEAFTIKHRISDITIIIQH